MTLEPADQQTALQGACLTWAAHPARQHPMAAVFAVVAIGALALGCGMLMNVWWGLAAFVVMILPLSRFFFPSRFSMDEEGVTAQYRFASQRYAWSEIRRHCCDAHGVYLSTRSRRSRLDGFRGMHILFGSSREEVLRGIRAFLADKGDAPCSG